MRDGHRAVASALRALCTAALIASLFPAAALAVGRGQTYVVNSANDVNDGSCNSTHCSLREAILVSNNTLPVDTIKFDIGNLRTGWGPRTIVPLSPLPTISRPVTIDGTTQPAFQGAGSCSAGLGHPCIEINGASAGVSNGLTVGPTGGGTGIVALAIDGFGSAGSYGNGIELDAGANGVVGCFIGTDPTGMVDHGNGLSGVLIKGTSSNLIGGLTPSARNVISGNSGDGIQITGPGASSNVVEGNYVGINAAGAGALQNDYDGVRIDSAPENVIGGTSPGAGNVISGNVLWGVDLSHVAAAGNVVQGNLIGTDASGTHAVGNNTGVDILSGAGNTIGGLTPAARNVISGNLLGVAVGDDYLEGATGNVVEGNYIGTDVSGTNPLGNRYGGVVAGAASTNDTIGGTAPGAGNVIAYNGLAAGDAGFIVNSARTSAISVRGNSIFGNTQLGIDLAVGFGDGPTPNDLGDADTGPNSLQNFPFVTSAASDGTSTTVTATLNSTASTTFQVDMYDNPSCDASGYGEGETYLGSAPVTTDAGGNASVTLTAPVAVPLGHEITATATAPDGSTSEFSPCTQVADPSVRQVSVQDYLFVPRRTGVAQGGPVQWNFAGPSSHTVTDASGMTLFDSGPRAAGATYSFVPPAAGIYPYASSSEPNPMIGAIRVPVKLVPGSGPVASVLVRWSPGPPPAGYVVDVQVRQPGAPRFIVWKEGQTGNEAAFDSTDPLYVGPGTYSFRARLRSLGNGAASKYSPERAIELT